MTDFLNHKKYNRQELPNNPEVLKDIIDGLVFHFNKKTQELLDKVAVLQAANTQLQQQNKHLQDQVADLQDQISLLKQEKFGRKSEKDATQSYSALRCLRD